MPGMSEIVKNIVRILAGFTLLLGIYIVLYGHIAPGGGFAGGAIIAGAFILLTLAYGKEVALKKLSRSISASLGSLGALFFLFLAFLGIMGGGYFFLNILPQGRPFYLFSAGIIPLGNISLGLKVGVSLFAVFVALAMTRIIIRKNGKRDYLEETTTQPPKHKGTKVNKEI
ncbi:hypothetical protein LR003_01495 [candidate division NPL-UPA2 bacterium]|nr:hypothetical protein [candidate division NPL-UPA2 bacterium]